MPFTINIFSLNNCFYTPDKLKHITLRYRGKYLKIVDDIQVILDILNDIEYQEIKVLFTERLNKYMHEIVWEISDNLYDFILDNAFTDRNKSLSLPEASHKYSINTIYFQKQLSKEMVSSILGKNTTIWDFISL